MLVIMKTSDKNKSERRRFYRIDAPVYYRDPRIFSRKRQISNISLAGIRIFSDDPLKKNDRFEIEIFLPSKQSIVANVRIVWIKELPPDFDSLYDVGLEFISLSDNAWNELNTIINSDSADN
jgi:c-di-GMP-binding flagellar brake protein YcgR